MTEHEKPREHTIPICPACGDYIERNEEGIWECPHHGEVHIAREVRVLEAEPVEARIDELEGINEFDIGVANTELKEDLERLRCEVLDLLEELLDGDWMEAQARAVMFLRAHGRG